MNVSYVPFLRYLTPNNGMPLNYRMSHKRDVGRRSRLFIIHPHLTLPLWGTMGSHRNTAITFGVEKLEWWSYQMVKKSLRICLFVSIQYTNVTDRDTDRWTGNAGRHRPRYACYAPTYESLDRAWRTWNMETIWHLLFHSFNHMQENSTWLQVVAALVGLKQKSTTEIIII